MASPVPSALFIGQWLPYSETFVHDQLCHQRRFHAHVFARGRAAGAARLAYPDVTALSEAESALLYWTGFAPRFTRELRAQRPRLIHAHFGTNGVLATPFARALGVPLVVSFHGHDVAGLFPQNRWTLRYARYQRHAAEMFEHASLLVCASSELADLLVSRAGAPAAKVVVHRLGIDLSRWDANVPRPGPLRVLMVGRLVEKKGMSHGLLAFSKLRRTVSDATLQIIGDGPLRAQLQRQAARLGMQACVELSGALPPDAVVAAMHRAHILMAPSVVARDGDRESGVLVLKEAAAAGLPTLGTLHGGIPEIIDDEVTGLLVPERDDAALSAALLRLAGDAGLRAQLGAAARRKMEQHYDTVRQHERLEELLASALR
jgi:glycosyltransferase involved in cell wall biosynthesis